MTHNDQKIKEILEKHGIETSRYIDYIQLDSVEMMKEYAEYILQQAIETIQNMPIETVGNSAQTIEQVIKELNKLKE